jgi:hypothetical protein
MVTDVADPWGRRARGRVINVIPIAVAAFVVMLACSLRAVTSYRRMTGITTGGVPAPATASGMELRAAKGGEVNSPSPCSLARARPARPPVLLSAAHRRLSWWTAASSAA